MKTISDINSAHHKGLELLDYVDKLLTQNNVWYSLAYGSVLGAVREHGFIQWDKDIDVVIKLQDQDRARDILQNGLPEHFCVHSCASDTVAFFDTITIKDVPQEEMHMDLYTLIGGPDDINMRMKHQKSCRVMHTITKCKYLQLSRIKYKWKVPIAALIKGICCLVADDVIRSSIRKRICKYPFDESNYLVPTGNDGKINEFMKKDIWLNTIRMDFDGLMLPIPSKYHEYLENLYGEDYMIPKKT